MDRHLESLALFEEEVNIYNTNTNNTNNNNNNNSGNGEYEYSKGGGFGTDYRNSNTYLRGKNVAQLVRGGGGLLSHTTNTSNTTGRTVEASENTTKDNIPTTTTTTITNTTHTIPALPRPTLSPSSPLVGQQEPEQPEQFQVASDNSTREGGGGGVCLPLHIDSSTDTHSDHYTPPQPTVDNNNSNNNVNISHVHTEDRCSASDDNIENIADTQPPVIHPTSGSDLSLLPVPPLPDQSVYSEADILTVYTSNEPDTDAGTGPKNPPHLSLTHTTTTTNTHEPQHPQHPLPTTTTTHTNNTIQFEQPQLGFKGAMAMMAELSKAVSRLKDDLFMFYFTDPNPNPNPVTACAFDQHSGSVSFPVSGLPLYTSTMDTGDCGSVYTHPHTGLHTDHQSITGTATFDEQDDDEVFGQLEVEEEDKLDINSSNTSTAAASATAVPTTANTISNTTGRSRRGRKKGSGTGSRHIHTRHAKLHEYERNYITPQCVSLLTTSITSTDTSDPDPTILSPFVDSRHTFLGRLLLHIYDVLYICVYFTHTNIHILSGYIYFMCTNIFVYSFYLYLSMYIY